jgi:hypothetical protein
MGQNAVYISIDDPTLDALWQLDDQPFRDRFLEIEEDQNFDRLDIAKIWDVLHCTLTGVTASKPIEGNKLSESIVGVHPKIYDDEDYSMFVSVIDNGEIDEILLALKAIDLAKLTASFEPATLRKQKVYPNGIWDDEASALVEEMDAALNSIREFFRCSLKDGRHILATIL